MRTHYSCLVCADAQRAKGFTQWELTPETGYTEVRLTSEPVALAECQNGHRSLLYALDGAYALLFERALQRIAIGSPRDAIIDAYTAFEMYLAHLPARARYDREKGASPMKLRDEMKQATGRAEPALGAALATVSIVSSRPPPKIVADATTNLRNRAVHSGHHATDQEAEAMCLEIERLVGEFEDGMSTNGRVNEQWYWDATIGEEIQATISKCGWAGIPSVGRQLATVLALTRPPIRNTFSAARRLEQYRKNIAEDFVHWRV